MIVSVRNSYSMSASADDVGSLRKHPAELPDGNVSRTVCRHYERNKAFLEQISSPYAIVARYAAGRPGCCAQFVEHIKPGQPQRNADRPDHAVRNIIPVVRVGVVPYPRWLFAVHEYFL